jgi:hypothetical protein
MKGKLDVAKMEAAFKRAAHKAVHGTREERSGRFVVQGDKRTSHRDAPKMPATSNGRQRKGS